MKISPIFFFLINFIGNVYKQDLKHSTLLQINLQTVQTCTTFTFDCAPGCFVFCDKISEA